MYHIAAHLPELLTDAKETVQNAATVIVSQVTAARNKDLKNLFTNAFANDPMRDDQMPVGADFDMAADSYTEAEKEDILAPVEEEPSMKKISQDEMDKWVEDFFSKI